MPNKKNHPINIIIYGIQYVWKKIEKVLSDINYYQNIFLYSLLSQFFKHIKNYFLTVKKSQKILFNLKIIINSKHLWIKLLTSSKKGIKTVYNFNVNIIEPVHNF